MYRFDRLSPSAQAVILMTVAVLFFSFMDAFARGLTQTYPPFEVIWARYFFQLLLSFLILAPHLKRLLRTKYFTLQMTRSLFLFGGTVGFFLGLSQMPLANVTAIFEVAPLFITAMAYFILKEYVGPRRWIAVIIGLIGALIIIQPGTMGFNIYSLLPLFSAVCFASYTISTRFLGREESPWTSFLYTGLIGTILASLFVPSIWVAPEPLDWLKFVAMGVVGMMGHFLLIRALTIGEASFLAPLAYISLIFNAIWGVLFYAEIPQLSVVIGAVIIVGAGLYIWRIESKSSKKPTSVTEPPLV